MKTTARILNALLMCALLAPPVVHALGEQAPDNSPRARRRKRSGRRTHGRAGNHHRIEQYRHSSVVQAIAHVTGLNTETAAQIFEDFNSGVFLFAIGFALWKFLPEIFRKRSEDLQKDLAAPQGSPPKTPIGASPTWKLVFCASIPKSTPFAPGGAGSR